MACTPTGSQITVPGSFASWQLAQPPDGYDKRVPLVWIGTSSPEAVLGTGSSITIASKDSDEPSMSGMPASPAQMGYELARADLLEGETAVIIIYDEIEAIQSVSASLQPWADITADNFALFAGEAVSGNSHQEGEFLTYTLEPMAATDDLLLVVSVVFDNSRANGDIVLIWRLNPGAQTSSTAPDNDFDDKPLDSTIFIEGLRAAGAEVDSVGSFSGAYFTGQPVLLRVNGVDIQLYEYTDPNKAVKEARESAPDGELIIPAEWIATPHFYLFNRIIVQYLGDDPDMIALLDSLLGPQFAGGPMPDQIDLNNGAENTNSGENVSIDTLNQGALIKIPFVRDGAVYLYEDGLEKLVATPTGTTSKQNCFNLTFPFLSPDSKYLAYIDQAGEPYNEYWGCFRGNLKLIEMTTGVMTATPYQIQYFSWTQDNLIHFTLERELVETPPQFIIKEIFFDPVTETEKVFETIMDQDPTSGQEMLRQADYPSAQLHRLIRMKEGAYYFVDTLNQQETFLFNNENTTPFLEWSPDGRYAFFATPEQTTDFYGLVEIVVDTHNLNNPPIKLAVGRGAAGGDFPTGRKWYFDQGFVPDCREEMYFLDGRSPLQLTKAGEGEGGGCHNTEGFVATSPGGQYAVLKFQDRFELHQKDGTRLVIEEAEPVRKGRGIPKNFIWINDDFMIIYESAYGYHYGETPTIYLFDRQANIIKPVIENAYLIDANT